MNNPTAMILAAGYGKRMGASSNTMPKPLTRVHGKPLIEHLIIKLANYGIKRCVINVSHLAEQITSHLGDGTQFGLAIDYSPESEPLEVGGGIRNALDLLGDTPFVLVNSDLVCNYDLSKLITLANQFNSRAAHLVLGVNPPHNPNGDFAFKQPLVSLAGEPMFTYIGCGVYHPKMFSKIEAGSSAKLRPLLEEQIKLELVTGDLYLGNWLDVGTPKRVSEAEADDSYWQPI